MQWHSQIGFNVFTPPPSVHEKNKKKLGEKDLLEISHLYFNCKGFTALALALGHNTGFEPTACK